MPPIAWVRYTERVVGAGHPSREDVDNRPLRQIISLHGHDPDDQEFPGLHHFPNGVFTDEVTELTPAEGIAFRSAATFDETVDVAGKVTILSDLEVVEPGQITGLGRSITITEAFVVRDTATFDVDTLGTFTDGLAVTGDATFNNDVEVKGEALLGILHMKSEGPFEGDPLFPYTMHRIATRPFVHYHVADGFLTLFAGINGTRFVTSNLVEIWREGYEDGDSPNDRYFLLGSNGVPAGSQYRLVAPFEGLRIFSTGTQDFDATHIAIQQAQTGWGLITNAPTVKGGGDASTMTVADLAGRVNGLISLMMDHHKLASA